MIERAKHFYEFGQFRIDEGERVLLREGQPVPLAPKVFDTLLALIKDRGHVIEKERLMKELWPDTFVEEATLAQNISTLRKALGETSGQLLFSSMLMTTGCTVTGAVAWMLPNAAVIVAEPAEAPMA